MSDTDEQQESYLLWRLQSINKYSAIAYLSSEFVLGRALPRYFTLDYATYGRDGVEDVEASFFVEWFPRFEGSGHAEFIGEANTLIAGIRLAESHWASQGIEEYAPRRPPPV